MTAAEPTVEEALRELREMVGHGVYLCAESKGIYYPSDYGDKAPLLMAFIDVDRKHFYAPILTDCMTQIRTWHKETQK